jgi:hypothetical protein
VDAKLKFFINLDTDNEIILKFWCLCSICCLQHIFKTTENSGLSTITTNSERFVMSVLIGTHLHHLIKYLMLIQHISDEAG